MAIMVSLGTGCTMMRYARTMTDDTICGLAEHVRGDGCYEAGLVCTDENRKGHAYSEACYPMEYTCGLEAVEPHAHGEDY